MEVHHHGHVHEKSKWKEYIFQFFMLFLAVFCGYLAEMKLEHSIEHQREKAYLTTLSADLKKDITEITRIEILRGIREKKLDSLIVLLGSKDLAIHAREIYRLVDETDSYETFLRNDRTIQQLKASGGMRMIRKEEVASSIMDYDNFIISEVDWNNHTESDRIDYYKQQRFQLFNAQSLYGLSKGDTAVVYQFLPSTAATVNMITGSIFQVKRISETNRDSGVLAKQRATKLLALIKEKYHID